MVSPLSRPRHIPIITLSIFTLIALTRPLSLPSPKPLPSNEQPLCFPTTGQHSLTKESCFYVLSYFLRQHPNERYILTTDVFKEIDPNYIVVPYSAWGVQCKIQFSVGGSFGEMSVSIVQLLVEISRVIDACVGGRVHQDGGVIWFAVDGVPEYKRVEVYVRDPMLDARNGSAAALQGLRRASSGVWGGTGGNVTALAYGDEVLANGKTA